MDFTCLFSSRHQAETEIQNYAEIEDDRDQAYQFQKKSLKVFVIRKWMTVYLLFETESALWKDGKTFSYKC